MPGEDQLALSRPDVLVRKRRMTKRQQRVAFYLASNAGHSFTTRHIGLSFGYSHPGAALAILVERGQAERVRRGVYRHHEVVESLTDDALPAGRA